MKLLFLLPALEYSSAARQVSLLAPLLRSEHGIDVHIAVQGTGGPAEAWLAATGVPLHLLGGRTFPPAVWQSLRRLLREFRPDIVHAWRLPALRPVALHRRLRRYPYRLVVSEPGRGGRINPLDRWLLYAADNVVAGYPAEAHALRHLGISAERICVLPPAVALPSATPPPLPVSLPPGAKVVMCIGNLTAGHAFRDAAWAADILRYPLPELHLVIIGDGPDRERIARFARGVNPAGGQVHFVPARPDAAGLLAWADMVWVPSRCDCGRQVLLEAQATARPVVASAVPGLAALIEDDRTGQLTPPGEPVTFARRARRLIEDSTLAEQIGSAAREAVAVLAPSIIATKFVALYATIG